jgi:hypothetical protein
MDLKLNAYHKTEKDNYLFFGFDDNFNMLLFDIINDTSNILDIGRLIEYIGGIDFNDPPPITKYHGNWYVIINLNLDSKEITFREFETEKLAIEFVNQYRDLL